MIHSQVIKFRACNQRGIWWLVFIVGFFVFFINGVCGVVLCWNSGKTREVGLKILLFRRPTTSGGY